MHDVTALRTDGIEDLLRRYPDVQAEVDAGYQGLARDFPGQVSAPPKKPCKDAPPEGTARWNSIATSSPPSGSASSTPSPNPGSGGPCSAGSAGASTYRKPFGPSLDWSPTAPPRGNHTSQPRQASTATPQSCTCS
jgi:hypothetical protein